MQSYNKRINKYRDALIAIADNPHEHNLPKELLFKLAKRASGEIARNVITELERVITVIQNFPVLYTIQGTPEKKLCFNLVACLKNEEFTRAEFLFFIDSFSYEFMIFLLDSPYFPIDIILDNNFFKRFETNGRSLVKLQLTLGKIKNLRYDEIMVYYRSIIDGSEYMSDEMVLSITGVKAS